LPDFINSMNSAIRWAPHLGAAPRRVNPSKVVLAIESRQPIEEPRCLRVGMERGNNVGCEGFALRPLGRERQGDRISKLQTGSAAERWT
jgi:hypothetical protein